MMTRALTLALLLSFASVPALAWHHEPPPEHHPPREPSPSQKTADQDGCQVPVARGGLLRDCDPRPVPAYTWTRLGAWLGLAP